MIKNVRKKLKKYKERFKKGVNATWDNKFKLCCVCKECKDGFIVRISIKEDKQGTQVRVLNHKNAFNSNQVLWNYSQDTPEAIAAHEVGHFLGNIDEYNTITNIKFSSKVTYEGVKGKNFGKARQPGGNVMNNPSGEALPIHLWYVSQKANVGNTRTNCRAIKIGDSCDAKK